MPSFPAEIASFPFYATFHQILMAAVNANQAAQLSYLRNLQMIAFQGDTSIKPTIGGTQAAPTLFKSQGQLNMVEFDSRLETDVLNPNFDPDPNVGESTTNPRYITETVDKHVRVPLLAIVDVRPMAIDKLTSDLSISLKSEYSKTDTSQFNFGQDIDVELDLGFLNVKSHTSISYSKESAVTQGTTREYNLEVHMEASTQPLNAPLQNIINYLIRTET